MAEICLSLVEKPIHKTTRVPKTLSISRLARNRHSSILVSEPGMFKKPSRSWSKLIFSPHKNTFACSPEKEKVTFFFFLVALMKNPSTLFKWKKWQKKNLYFQVLGDRREEISLDSFNSVSFSKCIKFYRQPCVHMGRYVRNLYYSPVFPTFSDSHSSFRFY